jgi:Protein of unknown function (DUF2934)
MPSRSSTTRPGSDTAKAPLQIGDMPHAASFNARRGGESRPEPSESRMNRIARRAHEIYQARGGQDGTVMEDWLTAERQIDDEIDRARENVE